MMTTKDEGIFTISIKRIEVVVVLHVEVELICVN